MTERIRCYYCGQFITLETAIKNWRMIQAPGVADPEPYEIIWCDGCDESVRREFRATDLYVERSTR